ncbi:MAG: hypothetical protein WCO17_12105 [Betaproteobacteria bacterium]
MTPTAASSRASRLTYERYLDFLAKAKIAAGLPAIGAVEENLLADILRFTSTGQHLGVVAAMSLNAQKTSITNFRILKKLRLQGWITLRVGETDERFKWVELSKLALRYFALHDKCLLKALAHET